MTFTCFRHGDIETGGNKNNENCCLFEHYSIKNVGIQIKSHITKTAIRLIINYATGRKSKR